MFFRAFHFFRAFVVKFFITMSSHTNQKKHAIRELLEVPWLGLRPDVVLHSGPLDADGQRSYILEDPVRGSHFQLGYAEGELLYRLITTPDPDAAAASLYAATPLRPSPPEIAVFITMLQREGLALLPKEEIIRKEAESGKIPTPSFFARLLQGAIFFRIPLLKPDAFLNRTYSYISWLWSPLLCKIYILTGLLGLIRTVQEIELYLSTVSYLFTPQGGLAFFLCLSLLKAGHEFAHAYAVKSLGKDLHIRTMGIFFIVFWPLLYTDTTDVWKIPDRRLRMKVSLAGIFFELTVAGIALLLWSVLPDGILRSLMFFLSGTSIVSSVVANLNPFMRFDGYYVLMDWWGIDNLRPRSFALLRYRVRRILLDWKGPEPESHPRARSMILYGILAIFYRLFIGFSIAVAAYYLFLPILGIVLFSMELWLFIVHPLWGETAGIVKNRHYIGSKFRVALSAAIFLLLCFLLTVPVPRFERVPGLILWKETVRMESPQAGKIDMPLPQRGQTVSAGDLLTRISSDSLLYEAQNVRFDLESVRASAQNLSGGGEQGAYRNWLMAEEKRLMATADKLSESIAQLEIRAPVGGRISDINEDLYEGAFVDSGTWLFTLADQKGREIKAYLHEKSAAESESFLARKAFISLQDSPFRLMFAPVSFREKSLFPVHYFPNDSLFDIAGGPILSVQDTRGRKPRDAYFAFSFDIAREISERLPHGMPCRVWTRTSPRSVIEGIAGAVWKSITERGLF